MQKFTLQLSKLRHGLTQHIAKIIDKRAIEKGNTIENSIRVPNDLNFYVEGRKITHVSKRFLVADGYHYDHKCMDIEEFINLVETLK